MRQEERLRLLREREKALKGISKEPGTPKGPQPPQLVMTREKREAALIKGRATRQANIAKKREQTAALKNAALIERQIREATDPERFKVPAATVLEQIRERVMSAIELADIQAREDGHAHGLASLMAADLRRNPTATLVAWSKLLPGGAGGGGGGSNTEQHLDAVRALTVATTSAARVAQLAVGMVERGRQSEIDLNAADIREIHNAKIDCDNDKKLKGNFGDSGLASIPLVEVHGSASARVRARAGGVEEEG